MTENSHPRAANQWFYYSPFLRRCGSAWASAMMLSALLLPAPAIAQDAELPVHACAAAVGTFLTGDASAGVETSSRSLIALTNGGHVMFVDSGQRGGPEYAAFSDGLGRWQCLSSQGEDPRLHAVLLDFTFPEDGDQEIGRVDFEGTVDPATGELTATATLSFFPLDSDPLTAEPSRSEQFTLSGRKIDVP